MSALRSGTSDAWCGEQSVLLGHFGVGSLGGFMLNRKALLLVFCCFIFSTIAPLLYGQATGSFEGTVSDKTGSVISGATVKVTSQGTAQTREAKTDDTGHYLIPLVPIGTYTVHVESQGFQTSEQ